LITYPQRRAQEAKVVTSCKKVDSGVIPYFYYNIIISLFICQQMTHRTHTYIRGFWLQNMDICLNLWYS